MCKNVVLVAAGIPRICHATECTVDVGMNGHLYMDVSQEPYDIYASAHAVYSPLQQDKIVPGAT